ncbi:xanthine dehydrogenase family protein subunit M [Paracoccus sp. M683]|uniref:FAD binding domain-containing protein n=1 Tax=Paracoccus sp. M683 TaxID=2594268 RepID=UPI0011812729|nr:xanthine dehydrogenase family protein subunit M [Paracoccus sp. M683]TRW97609.1 xanthine dehydrogenase family protein subunit M [Paracoccus sp. M683]
MTPFDYIRAADPVDAVAQLQAGGTLLAGGTNLIDHLKLGIATPTRLIDISRLPLTNIDELPDGGLRIGAMVRNSDLAANPLIRARFPLVAQALLSGASGQLRNMASTGGNLMQRSRCVYFQNLATPCNKRDPGSGCPAREGFGRHNAIFETGGQCMAVHPSDLCVPLAALDAMVIALGRQGERRIPFADFHRPAGDTPQLDTNLAGDELITAIELPPLPATARSSYRKIRDRASFAFALVSVAAALEIRDGRIQDIRLALGGVAHRPHRARLAEQSLRGARATVQALRDAAEVELAQAQTGHDNGFKLPMLRNAIVAVLAGLAGIDESPAP